jgi:DNA/RNA endonuclease G (NUC1)
MPNHLSTASRVRVATLILALLIMLSAGFLISSPRPASAATSELFFSEYIEGSSNNKALEIYNGTGVPVDLAAGGYSVQMFFNGSPTAGLTINLTGTVATGDVFVVAQSLANASILAVADQTNSSGWFNGDDAVVLRKGTTIIDVIGQIGLDPGTEWGTGLTSTADNTLRRKPTICAGDTNGADAFDPAIEWDGFANDTFAGLGSHSASCGDPTPTPTPTPNQAIIPSCPASLNTVQGTPASTGVSASDPDGTVASAAITSAPVAGITLDNFVAAGGVGGTATATLNVANTTAAGMYSVVIQYSNNDSPTPQTASCTVVVTVTPPNQAINTNCPTPLSTIEGTATSEGVSATDPDGTVTSAAITSAPVAGITLNGFTPAASSGGTANATLNVANTTAPGTYNVDIQYSNNDATPQTATCTVVVTVNPPPTPASVVISQVYGGGGNTGATLKNDYIELINHSGAPVNLSGWSVQAFVSNPAPGTWVSTPLPNFTLQPGQYFLIQESQGAGGTDSLPTPDAVGTIAVSSTSTKVALMNNTTLITGSCPNAAAGLVDLVGYGGDACHEGSGAAPLLTNTTAVLRRSDGCFDTDDNARDFVAGSPVPRNSSSPINSCTGLLGYGTANPKSVVVGASTTLTVHAAAAQNPTSTGISVTADLSQIGGSTTQSFSGGPNSFSFVANVPANNPTGMFTLPVTISDLQGRTGSASITVKVLPVIPDHITISQLYGGGGNSGATYNHDYVELYNPYSTPFDLTGWSLQYGAATGDTWQVQPLGGAIAPGEYYLIGLATGNATIGTPLPPANVNGDINMSATTGKIALVNSFDALVGPCPTEDVTVVDFLGYGGTANCAEGTRAAAPSNTTSLFRKSNGSSDTDNNLADFITGAPNPRRTAPIVEIGPAVFATDPRNGATSAPRDATIVINFTEPVTTDSGWFDINCVSTGNHNLATVRSFFGGDTHTITPNTNFLAGEQCTVTIFKNAIHDVDTDDAGPNDDSLPANKVFTFTVATGTAPPYPPSVHTTFGNPSGAGSLDHNNFLMQKPEYALSYNRARGTANWVSWHLSDEWIGTLARVDSFRADPAIPEDWYRVSGFDYVGSGFDRGHMVPNADRDKETSTPINQATFLMTNMIPQAPDNNQGPWANLEGYLRTLTPANEVYIIAGGAGTGGTGSNGAATTIAGGNVTVPAQTWKVALIIPKQSGDDVSRVNCSSRTLAVVLPNIQGIRNHAWEDYITTVDAVESLTSYDFFANLPDAIENCVEAGTNGANLLATANQSASTQEDSPVEITLQAARPNTNPITFSTVSGPTNGSLGTISAPTCTDFACSATVTYSPGLNYNGADSFTFKVSDGTNESNTSTVSITITPLNDNPDAVDDTATVAEDSGANTINVRANDGDVDGDTLTVTAVTQGTNGAVAITNSGVDVSYTPNANFFGTDSFTYTVSDGNGGSDTATVNITVTNVNDAPELTSSVAMTSISATNSNLFNVGLTASATDADGETPTIVVTVFGDEDDETATIPGVVHSPDAKNIAPNTLRLRGERVEANDGRVYLIIVTATDPSGGITRNYHTVVVPKNNKPASTTSVNAQAAAAIAFASANNGTPPSGYFVIGDGAIIGPKQ